MLILDKILSVIAPHDCLGCGQEGSLLCGWCRAGIVPIPSRCSMCKRMTTDASVCAVCITKTPLRHVWVVGEYDGLIKDLITKFKFGYAASAAPIVASLMADVLPYLDESWTIVYVPTASSRVRNRGFDHARLIARSLSAMCGASFTPALRRYGQSRQVGASKKMRMAQLKDAYIVKQPESIKGKRILLVDDITTTGATLNAAARALKGAGARSVSAVVFAQKSL